MQIEKKLFMAGISVLYRPHPNEDYYSKFNKIDKRSTSECILGPKKYSLGMYQHCFLKQSHLDME